jgi:hypothetical protein
LPWVNKIIQERNVVPECSHDGRPRDYVSRYVRSGGSDRSVDSYGDAEHDSSDTSSIKSDMVSEHDSSDKSSIKSDMVSEHDSSDTSSIKSDIHSNDDSSDSSILLIDIDSSEEKVEHDGSVEDGDVMLGVIQVEEGNDNEPVPVHPPHEPIAVRTARLLGRQAEPLHTENGCCICQQNTASVAVVGCGCVCICVGCSSIEIALAACPMCRGGNFDRNGRLYLQRLH